ncbi:hypothetical protein BOX15_Mlig030976g3 [Macrostomum lignano]|uniref:RING-type domain-containing protein n=1 Tax=Macrostomum lignano TaxID=282301 RepID=A0A267G538_9PLAT|nr:hypothetical protein BOX15_Mlig030976g3 [Macrostomum lignano]
MKMDFLQLIPSSTLDVLLRVPFLFIIDNTLNTELPSIIRTQHVEAVQSVDRLSGNGSKLNREQYKLCLLKDIGKDTLSLFDRFFENTINIDDCPPQSLVFFLVIIIPLFSFIFKSAVIALAGLASVLDSDYLRAACANLVSVLMAYYSYRSSCELVRAAGAAALLSSPDPPGDRHSGGGTLGLVLYCNSQLLTALLLSRCLLADLPNRLQRLLRVVMFAFLQLPLIFTCVGAPDPLLSRSPMLSVCPAACLINAQLLGNADRLVGQSVRAVRNLCRQARALGLEGVIEQHWARLRVPLLLRVFWLLKAAYYLVTMLLLPAEAGGGESPTLISALQAATLGRGSENLLSLLGMTAVISWLSQLIVLCFAKFISLHDYEEWQYGTVSAMLFFLLALQAGITGLPADDRVSRLYRNLCLMVSALLHFVHNMCQQALRNRWLSLARLHSLSPASEELLQSMGDVCAICYSDLQHRDCRVTPCRHVFHSACIRRWIAVSMDCPMCHQAMFT